MNLELQLDPKLYSDIGDFLEEFSEIADINDFARRAFTLYLVIKKLVDAEKNNKEFVAVNKNTEDSSTLIFTIHGENRKELKSLASKLDKTEGQVITDALNYYNNSLKEYEDEHNL